MKCCSLLRIRWIIHWSQGQGETRMGKVVRITVYGMGHNVFVMRVGMVQLAPRMIPVLGMDT